MGGSYRELIQRRRREGEGQGWSHLREKGGGERERVSHVLGMGLYRVVEYKNQHICYGIPGNTFGPREWIMAV